MNTSSTVLSDKEFVKRAVEASIRIGLILLIAGWCLQIVGPFILPVLWAIIIAVAIHPLFQMMQSRLGGRSKLTATIITLLGLAILIIPTVMLSKSLIQSMQYVSSSIQDGSLVIPLPPQGVSEWPLIGESLDKIWTLAATNLEAAITQIAPQLKSVGKGMLSAAAGVGGTIVQFVISIIIMGVLLTNAEGAGKFARKLTTRLVGDKGEAFAQLASDTISSVAKGVLGVAIIQAVLAGIGLLAAGVPGAGLWALLVLLLAVVQLPPILILGPIIAYQFTVVDTTPAVLFMIWSLLVSASDAFLKPMFLGRGMETPMLVILLGAIGGMILSGIIGLFVGAVVLALGYDLFMAWVEQDMEVSEEQNNPG